MPYNTETFRHYQAFGLVVEVRRSSDDAERFFTAAEVADGTLVDWVGAGDGHVVTWYDQSGNGNHATQATPASQPKVVDGGVLVDGGVSFDGVDDVLLTNDYAVDCSNSSILFAVSSSCYGMSDSVVLQDAAQTSIRAFIHGDQDVLQIHLFFGSAAAHWGS